MQNNELQQFVDDVSADEVRLYRSASRCNAPSMRNDAYYTLLNDVSVVPVECYDASADEVRLYRSARQCMTPNMH